MKDINMYKTYYLLLLKTCIARSACLCNICSSLKMAVVFCRNVRQ